MFDALVLFVHILAATIFVGPQVFLAAVAVPALRGIGDERVREQATRAITRGFGALGGGALLVLLATGIWNYYDADDAGKLEFQRYFTVLQVKLTLVTLVIVLTAVHGMVFGRRLQRLRESGAPEAEIEQTRRWTMMFSMANLAVSIGVVFCAALLASDWSLAGDLR